MARMSRVRLAAGFLFGPLAGSTLAPVHAQEAPAIPPSATFVAPIARQLPASASLAYPGGYHSPTALSGASAQSSVPTPYGVVPALQAASPQQAVPTPYGVIPGKSPAGRPSSFSARAFTATIAPVGANVSAFSTTSDDITASRYGPT